MFDEYDHILAGWDNRVLLTHSSHSAKRFKALNQSLVSQINSNLMDRDRLWKRTVADRDGKFTEIEESERFDDGDFYQQLMRDLISRRMVSLSDAAVDGGDGKKQRKPELTKTKKKTSGRQLKYNVHDRIQNFMVPIEVAKWSTEQTDELYNGLLGQSHVLKDIGEDRSVGSGQEEEEEEEEEVQNDGLRIFA